MKKFVNCLLSASVATGCLLMGSSNKAFAVPQPLQSSGRITGEFNLNDEPIRLPGSTIYEFGSEYTLDVSAGDTVELLIEPGLGNPDPDLFVQRPDGSVMVVNQSSLSNLGGQFAGSTGEYFYETARTSGTFQFVVYSYGSLPGQYVLDLDHLDRYGNVVDQTSLNASQVLQQLGLASVDCAPGAIQVNIDGMPSCALPTATYPLDRSPFNYDAATQTLVSTIPETPQTVEAVSYSFSCEERVSGFSLVVETNKGQEGTLVNFLQGTTSSSLSPRDRCNIVAGRLQAVARRSGSSLDGVQFEVGQSNNAQIVCALSSAQSSCNGTNQLYQVTAQTQGIHDRLPRSGQSAQDAFARILR